MTQQPSEILQEPLSIPVGITSISYIDSVEIQQRNYFTSDFLEYIKANCGSMIGPRRSNPIDRITFESLWLHQPTKAAIEYLEDKKCKITRAQIALDLLPQSKQSAKELQEFLARTFLLQYKPKDKITWLPHNESVDPTCYFGFTKKRGPGKTAALYADKVSKVTNKLCCHLEVRYELSKTLQANSINSARHLLQLDHRKFWEKRLILVYPPTAEELADQWERAFIKRPPPASKRFPYGGRTLAKWHIGNRLLRAAIDKDGYTNANDLIHFLRTSNPLGSQSIKKLFHIESNSWLLPPSNNALWEMNNHD